ncbi:MAG: UDP-N-acetylglucosamine 2-epimerase [Methanoregula sp.]|uniref:UDP-N-acetylglucosamine 2-epimerase n=1 Tax=Methanoregula sp. TaxID=2052170 RepID=UPI0025E29B4F|nr:UDP-N-acetylglucosamine 2-epimerase [Methanoregula sp.]MCK9631766.1 UDP-N-acetylglucosamine 2-epimerase [Methanoregula sp.]
MKKRKICVVITARPSYSRIKTALQAIQNHPDLELQLIVAASALLDRYGTVSNYIEKDGFTITARVFNVIEGENLAVAAKTTGVGILELSTIFDNIKPDIVVTVADRFETMATAICAAYMNIPLAHIQGGEVTGNIDEKVRHAITKLADYHFVSSQGAYDRVIKLGEDPRLVFNTGCPSIDLADKVLQNPELDFDPFTVYGGVGTGKCTFNDGYLVVLQHPVTTEYDASQKNVEETLHAIQILNIPTFWFWPNVDAGSDGTSKGIRAFRERHPDAPIHFFKNMEPDHFLKILKNSLCLIGNSSVGIRECAYMGVPVVNIGTRQDGRDRGNNVIDVDYDRKLIVDAIRKQIQNGPSEKSHVYGGGCAGEIIADLLSKVELKFSKKISY